MRVVLQRVSRAAVRVDGRLVSSIKRGLVVLVGIEPGDDSAVIAAIVVKIAGLRVFADGEGKMNRSISDVRGELLLVSQFTLLADTRRGRRPSFDGAAPPETALPLISEMASGFERLGLPTSRGEFGASMDVELVNEGPVTIVLDFPSSSPG